MLHDSLDSLTALRRVCLSAVRGVDNDCLLAAVVTNNADPSVIDSTEPLFFSARRLMSACIRAPRVTKIDGSDWNLS